MDHQGQFRKIQDVRSSKLSLDVQFHAFMAEILVKVAYPKLRFYNNSILNTTSGSNVAVIGNIFSCFLAIQKQPQN